MRSQCCAFKDSLMNNTAAWGSKWQAVYSQNWNCMKITFIYFLSTAIYFFPLGNSRTLTSHFLPNIQSFLGFFSSPDLDAVSYF